MAATTMELVRRLYDAFGAKDANALREVLSPDVRWTQCPGFPGGADRTGADSVIEGVMGGLNAAWEGFRVELDEFLDAGDAVVVIGAYEGTSVETGRTMRSVFTHVYEGDGTVITRFRQYADTWPMVEALGKHA